MELETAEWLEDHLYHLKEQLYMHRKNIELLAVTNKDLLASVESAGLIYKEVLYLYNSARERLEEIKAQPMIDDDRDYQIHKEAI